MSHSRQLISRREAQPPFFAGIDLGGTSIKAGVVDDRGRPLSWHSQATLPEEGPEAGARRLGETALAAIAQAGLQPADVARIGLGSPGTIDKNTGKLIAPSNLPGWSDFPLRDRVAEYAARPVSFANDASSAAFGEFWVGSGQAFASMVLLTLGTGVGGGIIIGNFSIDGENGAGAELGHIIIDYNDHARLCSCGGRGHLEAYASATALVQRAGEALSAGGKSSLQTLSAEGRELTPLVLAEHAEAGDELSRQLILDTAMYLGVGIVTVMHTIDPTGIVIGGAMTFGGNEAPLGREFLARVRQEVHHRAFPLLAERITIDYARLGGDAGFIGAAGIARRDFLTQQ